MAIILGLFLSPFLIEPKEIVVLDREGRTGWYNSITLHGSTVLLSYYDARFFKLKLARCEVGSKFCERPRTVLVESSPAWFAALKVNETTAVMSYYDARSAELNLLTCHISDALCTDPKITLLDTKGDVGRYNALALKGNTVLISYYDASLGDLKLATCQLDNLDCVSLQTITIDSNGDVGQFSSLALTGKTAVISYYDVGNPGLKLAKCSIDRIDVNICLNPQIATVETSASVGLGWYSALALADDGTVVMSYYDGANADLKLATCNLEPILCKTARIVTVDSEGSVGLFTSIALNTDKAVISYYNATNGHLKLAICNIAGQLCNTRQIVTLDTDGNVGKFTSLVVHKTQAIVGYQDATRGHLKLARYQLP
jgi:hypothetical protein